MELEPGRKGTAESMVTRENTARAVGSGNLLVFSTPYMIALMEEAACQAVKDALDEGCATVGTMLNVTHSSATPVGMEVRAEAELTAVEGRKLHFHVTAYDEKGLIGEGEHERFVIFEEKFLQKTYSKI